ncbi:hypothetical protein KKH39_04145 [Patescibacteria group bacterium]|nr:hypothetical protein [Patescibacteria group bacterium]
MKEIISTMDDLFRRSQKDSDFLYNIFKTAYKKAKELNILTKNILQNNLADKNISDLVDYCRQFDNKFVDFYKYGTVPTLMGYTDQAPIYQQMENILKDKTKDNPSGFADYLMYLTSPLDKMKTQDLEIKILELAKIAKDKNFAEAKDILDNFENQLNQIHQEHGYLSYNFAGELGWDLDHYINMILEKLNTNIFKRLDYLKNYDEYSQNNFVKAVSELGLNKQEERIFKLVADIGYYKWIREYEFQEACYNISFIYKELGERLNLSTLEVMNLYSDEIENKKDLKTLAQKRIANYFLIVHRSGEREEYYDQAAIKKMKLFEFPEDKKINKNISEIKGMPAKAGRVKGRVKIVDKMEDMKKMNKGDVLVSQATTPDLMPAIKKATAIVTNEGGITCHAAIVSRELDIPCVVGTKIATKILQDGDMIEVDADRGIIKKL